MSKSNRLKRAAIVREVADGVKEISVAPGDEVCDFCLAPNPTWEYPAGQVEIDLPHPDNINRSRDEWAACDACHDLIERGPLIRLAVRICHEQLGDHVHPVELAAAMNQVRRFGDARTGEARPFQS